MQERGSRFDQVNWLLEKQHTHIKCAIKAFLLAAQRLLDHGFLGAQFGEDVAHGPYHDISQLIKERLVKTEGAPVTDRAAQDAAQDIATTFVAGLNAIRDGKAQRAD